ncbi:MAG: dihydrolipoyl dehydrogenase [Spirochaetaceae bacterium]|nr:MAG: dihydrolipoyl dehydrogenase [Spirochaetaceae bacterium]
MADKERYQMLVIGAGPAGYVAALRGARLGLRTALVDKRPTLGGTCLNVGCIPSKALLDSSEQYHKALHGLEAHGLKLTGVTLDLPTMMKRKDSVVEKLTGGVAMLCKKAGVDVYTGTARLVDAHTVEVSGGGGAGGSGGAGGENGAGSESMSISELTANAVVLATGSVPVELPSLPFDGKQILSSTEALSLETVPKQLAVVGAGAIGLEMASVWARLGSDVTVIELQPNILPGWDPRLSKVLQQEMEKAGVKFHLGAQVEESKQSKKGVSLSVKLKDGSSATVEAQKVLVAVGRKPYSEALGLEALGVAGEKGRVTVDEKFRTSIDGIYAVGDLIHGPMLAHKAEDDGFAVAEIIAGKPGLVDYSTVPNVVYTWPELAAVGSTEAQLKEAGIPFTKGQASFGANGRALAMEETAGFVKILAHAETDKILGAHIVGPWASDLIAEIVVAMEFGGSAEDLARTCHAHPTLSEVVREAALSAAGMPLHSA